MSRTFPKSNSSSQEIIFEEKAYSSSISLAELEFASDPLFSHLKMELSSSIIQLKTLDLALNSFMKLQKKQMPKKSAELFTGISISEKSKRSLKGSIAKTIDTFEDIEISLRA